MKRMSSPKTDQRKQTDICRLRGKAAFYPAAGPFYRGILVKTLEELGIGRPSTYAPTITTIIARRYIAKENKNLYVTELGEIVNKIMVEAFSSIVDVAFTANLEFLLDKIEEGTISYKTVIRNFYPDLKEAVDHAQESWSR